MHVLELMLSSITQPTNVLIVTDAGVDLDDEFALITAAALQRLGVINVLAATANMKPSIGRARLVRGTLTQLGYGLDLPDIPVGMGTGMIEKRNGEPCPTEDNCPYLAPVDQLHMGDERFVEILADMPPKSVTLVLQSGFTDAAALALFHSQLLIEKVREVVIMGGVMETSDGLAPLLEYGLMTPNDANNNTFNVSAAQIFYTWCQQNCLPMVITTRHAAGAAQVPFALYEQLKTYPSPIGPCLASRQYPSIQLLWERSNAPVGSKVRGPLPPTRDRQWFLSVFCRGMDVPAKLKGKDSIVPYLGFFNLYDPLNLVAAVPQWRNVLFAPYYQPVNGTTHTLIGLSPASHGIAEPDAVRSLLVELVEYGIMAASRAWQL